jgi:hypothetical protein
LTLDVKIHYDQSQQQLPSKLCISVFWEYENGEICEQRRMLPLIPMALPQAGTFTVPFPSSSGVACPKDIPCPTEDDVKSITVIVNDCGNGLEKINKYIVFTTPIEINYW